MKRRDFLKKAAVTAAASAALSPLMFASAQRGSYRFGMVTSWPTSLDTLHGRAVATAEAIRTMTDGDVDIEIFPAGSQVGALEVYDAVSSGAFEMGNTAPYYYITRRQAHAFFTAMPFGMNAQQHNAWLYQGNGQDLWDELNVPDNVIAFASGNTGHQMAGWFRREINTVEDLRGLTIRTPALGGQVMSRAGATVENLPGGEIYLALETGRIDAAEFTGPHDDEVFGFQRVAQYYYAPGWQEPGAALANYINLDVWNDLPEDIQTVIRQASQASNVQLLAEYDVKNDEALQRLVAGGTQVRFLSDEILLELHRVTNELHQEHIAADPLYARIYEDWRAFMDAIREFHRISEYSHHRFVYEVAPTE